MTKNKIIAFIIMISMFFCCSTVFAVDIKNADIAVTAEANGTVKVSGNYLSDFALSATEKALSVIIKSEDGTIIYIGQTGITTDKKISEIKTHLISEPTNLFIKVFDAMGNVNTKEVHYEPEICDLYNYVVLSSKDDLVCFLNIYGDAISFDADAYNSLTQTQKENVIINYLMKKMKH